MRSYLEKLIPRLSKAVLAEELPASQRRTAPGPRRKKARPTKRAATGTPAKAVRGEKAASTRKAKTRQAA